MTTVSTGDPALEAAASAFRDRVVGLGCEAPFEVTWAADHATLPHRHDFRAFGLVLAGSFTLTTPEGPRRLEQGDSFDLAAGVEHTETVNGVPTRVLAARLR